MVYCGKPSRGCQMCRARRIKCDETKPTCNQCAKSRRQCPGYKDEFDLVFRNETKATERRALKANRKMSAQKLTGNEGQCSPISDGSTGWARSSSPASPSRRKRAIAPSLQLSPIEQANCFFMSNFVLVPIEGSARGFMDYLVPLLKQDPQSNSLRHALNACSYAALGNRVTSNSFSFGQQALSEYTKAISAVYSALKDMELAKQDSTLAAIMLLGFFENITAKQMGSFAWGSHIEGAMELVRTRGKKGLRTKAGMMLRAAVRGMMIVHSQSTGTAPIQGTEWWMADGAQDWTTECHRLNLKTAELRADINRVMMAAMRRTPETTERLRSLIQLAQQYDQECAQWLRSVPERWRYHTMAWQDHVPDGDYSRAEVFPGRVDVYPDIWTASIWNFLRSTRLILASIIVRCAAWVCSPVDYRTMPEYATASRTAVETITDIISSVPYHLGWHLRQRRAGTVESDSSEDSDGSGDSWGSYSAFSFACGDDRSLKGLGGYLLTWPLTTVNGQDYLTDTQRIWVVGRLRFIGEHLGVHYALILSQLQLRIPSMLIRRDGLMADPYPAAHDFESLLSKRQQRRTTDDASSPVPPMARPGDPEPPMAQQPQESRQRKEIRKTKKELARQRREEMAGKKIGVAEEAG